MSTTQAVATFPICRIDATRQEVWSYACSDELGSDGLILDFDASVKAFQGWPGNVREAHSPKAVGRCLEWRPDYDSRRIWVGARIVDPTTWRKVEEGVLRAFSVKGPVTQIERRTIERNGRNLTAPVATAWEMEELSLVDRPGDLGVPRDFVQIVRNGAVTDVVAEGSLADADPLACAEVDRAAPLHAPMVGVHTHAHAGYTMDDGDPSSPHNHQHEHGADGTPDASHDHDHADAHAVHRADAAPYKPAPYHADPDETVKCPECGKMNDVDARYCDQCGYKLQGSEDVARADGADPGPGDGQKTCINCQTKNDSSASTCRHCGEQLGANLSRADAPTKSEGDAGDFPASAYAYVPDATKPSTWKLRLYAKPGDDTPDSGLVGAAAAALGAGFRGQKADIPDADRKAVVATVRAAWAKANPDKETTDMPEGIARAEQVIAIDALIADADSTLGRLYQMRRAASGAAGEETQIDQANAILTQLRALLGSEAGEDDPDEDTYGVMTLICAVNDLKAFIAGEAMEAAVARREEQEIMTAADDIARALGQLAESQTKTADLLAALVERSAPPAATTPETPETTPAQTAEVQRAASDPEAVTLEAMQRDMAEMRQLVERMAAQPAREGPLLRTEGLVAAQKFFPGEQPPTTTEGRTTALADLAQRAYDPAQRDMALSAMLRESVAAATGGGGPQGRFAALQRAAETAPVLNGGPEPLPPNSSPR